MSKLFIPIAAAIFALFILAVPSGPVVAASASSVQTYAYDGHHTTSHVPVQMLERGPPARAERATNSPAVVPGSHRASAFPDEHASRVETTHDAPTMPVRTARATGTSRVLDRAVNGALSVPVLSGAAAKSVDEFAEIGFRSDTSHIFRNATGHLADDTVENRALIKSALDPSNLRDTITLKDGATLQKYFRDLPDGTQAWAEVRNGQITNGGLNVIPR